MAQLVALGGSAGSIEALRTFFAELPETFDGTALVVVHMSAHRPSRLPQILARQTSMHVDQAVDGERIAPRTVRLAPSDHHLMVEDGHLRVRRGPRENSHRPSIDVLFRSVARWYGPASAAVLLSGGPGDGVSGLSNVQRAGGDTFVQDPADAYFSALPASALEVLQPTGVGSPAQLAHMVGEVRASVSRSAPEQAASGVADWSPSGFGCPDCNGALLEADDGKLVRYRCRVGHYFNADALLDSKTDALETALWSAINVMEERAELSERLASRAQATGYSRTSQRYAETSADMRRQVEQLRSWLAAPGPGFRIDPADDPQTVGEAPAADS